MLFNFSRNLLTVILRQWLYDIDLVYFDAVISNSVERDCLVDLLQSFPLNLEVHEGLAHAYIQWLLNRGFKCLYLSIVASSKEILGLNGPSHDDNRGFCKLVFGDGGNGFLRKLSASVNILALNIVDVCRRNNLEELTLADCRNDTALIKEILDQKITTMKIEIEGLFTYSPRIAELKLHSGDKSASTVRKWMCCFEVLFGLKRFVAAGCKSSAEDAILRDLIDLYGSTLEVIKIVTLSSSLLHKIYGCAALMTFEADTLDSNFTNFAFRAFQERCPLLQRIRIGADTLYVFEEGEVVEWQETFAHSRGRVLWASHVRKLTMNCWWTEVLSSDFSRLVDLTLCCYCYLDGLVLLEWPQLRRVSLSYESQRGRILHATETVDALLLLERIRWLEIASLDERGKALARIVLLSVDKERQTVTLDETFYAQILRYLKDQRVIELTCNMCFESSFPIELHECLISGEHALSLFHSQSALPEQMLKQARRSYLQHVQSLRLRSANDIESFADVPCLRIHGVVERSHRSCTVWGAGLGRLNFQLERMEEVEVRGGSSRSSSSDPQHQLVMAPRLKRLTLKVPDVTILQAVHILMLHALQLQEMAVLDIEPYGALDSILDLVILHCRHLRVLHVDCANCLFPSTKLRKILSNNINLQVLKVRTSLSLENVRKELGDTLYHRLRLKIVKDSCLDVWFVGY